MDTRNEPSPTEPERGERRRTHELKCWPEFYEAIEDGTKPFEVRFDDRGIAVGDLLRLREWTETFGYTRSEVTREVTFRLPIEDAPGFPSIDFIPGPGQWVVLGLAPPAPPVDEPGDDMPDSMATIQPTGWNPTAFSDDTEWPWWSEEGDAITWVAVTYHWLGEYEHWTWELVSPDADADEYLLSGCEQQDPTPFLRDLVDRLHASAGRDLRQRTTTTDGEPPHPEFPAGDPRRWSTAARPAPVDGGQRVDVTALPEWNDLVAAVDFAAGRMGWPWSTSTIRCATALVGASRRLAAADRGEGAE